MELATGRILQFDEMRAFGFIAADDNGEDIFLHSSVFDGEPSDLTPGTRVEFEVMEGGRGRKAFDVRILDNEKEEAASSQEQTTSSIGLRSANIEVTDELTSQVDFFYEVTELLLETVPSLTGGQVVQVRKEIVDLAAKHNWIYT